MRPRHIGRQRHMLPPASLSPCPRPEPRGPTLSDASLRSKAGWSTCAGPHPVCPRRPLTRFAHMPAQPITSSFDTRPRWFVRSSCCPPKIWPLLSAGSHRALRSSGVQLLLVGLVALVDQAVVVLADGRPHHTTSSGSRPSTALSALRMPSSALMPRQSRPQGLESTNDAQSEF